MGSYRKKLLEPIATNFTSLNLDKRAALQESSGMKEFLNQLGISTSNEYFSRRQRI